MAGTAITIAILANASQANSTLNKTASTAQKVGDKFRSLKGPAMLGLGALAVGAKAAIDSASDLNETISKTGEIFGPQAKEIESFATRAEQSLGQSKTAALEAASNFGLIGQKAGLSGQESAKFAKKFTTLASDLASFNNTSPEQAVEAIGAAMRGEAEPMRKYGVLLDDATLRARALKMGLIDNIKSALTPQQKALAASAEIMAQTTKAQGDFARTSDGAANKSRILAAQQENLRAKLGQQLLPLYVKFQNILSKVLNWMSQNQGTVQKLVIALAALSVTVLAVNAAMSVASAVMAIHKGITTASKGATIAYRNAQLALNLAMMANPIGLVVAAIVALVAVFVIAYKKSETFRAIVDKAWAGIKAATVAVWNFLKDLTLKVWNAIKDAATKAVDGVKSAVSKAWNAIKSVTSSVWNAIKAAIQKVWDWIKTGVKAYFNGYKTVITTVWNAIKAATSAVWNAIKSVVTNVYNNIKQGIQVTFNTIKTIITTAWNAAKTATTNIWNGIKTAVTNAVDRLMEIVRGIKGKVLGAFSGAASWLYSAGKDLIQGMINGVKNMAGSIASAAKDVVSGAINAAKNALKLGSPSKLFQQFGEWTGEGLVIGIKKKAGDAAKAASRLSTAVATGFEAPRLSLTTPDGSSLAHMGGNTYHIEVKVPIGASSADVGREITKHVEAYERAGGRRRK